VSVPTNVVDRIPLIEAIQERLANQLPGTTPPTKGYLSEAGDVPLLDGKHAQRYWVLHPWTGNPDTESDLADQNVQLAWGFQLTVAAGFPLDVVDLQVRADAALYRWTPVVEGHVCGRLHPPAGYDPGPPRPDKDFTPHRFWLPLQYQTTITRAS
jgi:hypothetical protein